MRKNLLAVLFLLLFGAFSNAQQTQQTAQQFNVAPINQAPNVTNASAVSDFEAGSTTRFYWIITHLAGVASTPVQTSDAKGPVALSNTSGGKVTISWKSPDQAATFDVLETATSTLPLLANCNCAVATNITGTSVVDVGTYSAYNTLFPQGFSWQIQQSYSGGVPSLNFFYNGTNVCAFTAPASSTCVPPGTGTVTSFSYTPTGLAPLMSSVVTNPTTTPNLAQTGATVAPGMVLAGPIPTASGVPAVLQTSAQNIGASLTQPTITGAPITANASTVIYTEIHSDGSHAPAPDVSWTTLDNLNLGNGAVYYKAISSLTPISLATVTGNYNWSNSLIFVGGTVSSIPHTATLTNAGTCTGINWCAQGTLSSVTANNAILVELTSGSTPGNPGVGVSCSDTLGNFYSPVVNIFVTSNQAEHYAFVATNVAAGSPVITCRSTLNTAFQFLSVRAYEIAGTASYYTGSQGPFSFRFLTPQDFGSILPPSISGFFSNVLSADVTVTTTATTIATISAVAPASGCPCRALISYSGWANFAGVTNEPDQDFWVSDGTTVMAGLTTGQSNASTGAATSVSTSGMSPVLYANGQAVTFTWLGIDSAANAGTQTFLLKAVPPTGAGPHTTFQVSFIPSK